MNEARGDIGAVVSDEVFPEVDLALRRGRHLDADDGAQYTLLVEFQADLEQFYRRYGFELMHSSDGFFYLLPVNERLGRRHLSSGEMLVGQALTLLYLDPRSLEQGRIVGRDQVLGQLAGSLGTDALVRVFNPKRRRQDERVAEETVRNKVAEALRRLASLGFVDAVEEDRVRLRPALLRFAEPVRGLTAPDEALERLVKRGEVVLTEPGQEPPPNPEDAADDTSEEEESVTEIRPDEELEIPEVAPEGELEIPEIGPDEGLETPGEAPSEVEP
jgi:chromosome partition protein MukE